MSYVAGSALRNWTMGNWANGTKNPDGAPSVYGGKYAGSAEYMAPAFADRAKANFQAITWAQTNAGYLDANGAQPNKSLETALQVADQRLGVFLDDLKAAGKLDSTLVLLGSKQGQGPINAKNETYFPSDNITSVLEADGIHVALFTADDGGIVRLSLFTFTSRPR